MKKIFYQIMGLCSILGVATACNEDPEYFTLDEQPDEMHIVASTDKLVLDKGKEDETAITFTWDAASSPVNETDLVTYSLRLYATANKSANNTDFYELDTDRKKSFTHVFLWFLRYNRNVVMRTQGSLARQMRSGREYTA